MYVAIDAVELSKDALMHRNGEDLGKVWAVCLSNGIVRKWLSLPNNRGKTMTFFNPIMQGGEAQRIRSQEKNLLRLKLFASVVR